MMPGRGNLGWSTAGRAGRPATGERRQHQVRAFDDEWELVKRFVQIVRKKPKAAEQALKQLEEGK